MNEASEKLLAGLTQPPVVGPSIAAQLRREQVFASLFGRQSAAPLKIGRFTLLECIGSGGMGELYAAYDTQLDRKVAIKLVRPDKRSGADAEQRLVREAQAAARLSHPNVVHVYESGVFEGRVYVAMEFVRGVDLREWLLAGPHDDAEILRRFVEAGRGLAAVHSAGLAHRDFKPANALVGADDRVRIVDFGLARHIGERHFEPAPSSKQPPRDAAIDDEQTMTVAPETGLLERAIGGCEPLATLTLPGTVLGTPRYMAPEQWRGARGDARSDQFSFCVALYEALYGVPPFHGSDTDSLLEAIEARQITAPKRDAKLPRSLREALVRGLAFDPERRWPSMDALLDELEGPLARTKQRWLGFGLVAAVALGLGLGLASLIDEPPRCAIDETVLASSWGPKRRAELVRAFSATGSSFASQSAATVGDRLDGWAQSFVESRRGACEATWVEGVQSEALLDLRTACFDRKREAFAVVVETFINADHDVVVRADELLAELPDLGECSNPIALQSGDPMPTDPDAAARVLDGYASLARARMLERRDPERSRTIAKALSEDPYAPLAIEAKALLAESTARIALEPGLLALRDAANEAERRGLLELEASIRVTLAREAVGDWSKPELEGWLIDEAEELLARLAQPNDPRRSWLLLARARQREQLSDYDGARSLLEQAIALAAGEEAALALHIDLANLERKVANYDEARALYLDALAQLRERWGERHPMLARVHYNLGILALERGDFDEAQTWLGEARTRHVEAEGPRSVAVAEVDFALAKLALSNGEFELARRQITELTPIFEAELGPEHETTARAHAALGVVRFYMGDLEGSLESYRRALPTFERVLGLDNDEVALMHANIGESLLGLGRSVEAAQACDRAIELLERVLPPTHPYLGVPHKVRGVALLDSKKINAAIADLELAVALLSSEGAEPLELADARFALARALLADPDADLQARDRATLLCEQAVTGFRKLGLDDRVVAIERWRAEAAEQ